MAPKRDYLDGCAAAQALGLVGERWALLVVRELLLGPKRFTDLRAGLPGISPNVLTQRLTELESASVLRRRKLAPPAAAWVYELTPWGAELRSIILELGRWGAQSPDLSRQPLSADSLMLSFTAMFDSKAAKGAKLTYELRFKDDQFLATIAAGKIAIARAQTTQVDAMIDTDPDTLAALVYDGQDLNAALRAGRLRYEGSKTALRRFPSFFSLPPPAAKST